MGVGAGFCMYDVVVNKFRFAISSPHEFLSNLIYAASFVLLVINSSTKILW